MATKKAAPRAKKGKKVRKSVKAADVFFALKKAPAVKGEVTGHIAPFPGAWYYCFNGHGPFWVRGGWTFFICPIDGSINQV